MAAPSNIIFDIFSSLRWVVLKNICFLTHLFTLHSKRIRLRATGGSGTGNNTHEWYIVQVCGPSITDKQRSRNFTAVPVPLKTFSELFGFEYLFYCSHNNVTHIVISCFTAFVRSPGASFRLALARIPADVLVSWNVNYLR